MRYLLFSLILLSACGSGVADSEMQAQSLAGIKHDEPATVTLSTEQWECTRIASRTDVTCVEWSRKDYLVR